MTTKDNAAPREPILLPIALNVKHPACHAAADAFWKYWRENGETHRHGYYESTWGAINAALRLVGTCEHHYGAAAPSAPAGDLERMLSDMRARWASIIHQQGWGDQFDGDMDALDQAAAQLAALRAEIEQQRKRAHYEATWHNSLAIKLEAERKAREAAERDFIGMMIAMVLSVNPVGPVRVTKHAMMEVMGKRLVRDEDLETGDILWTVTKDAALAAGGGRG